MLYVRKAPASSQDWISAASDRTAGSTAHEKVELQSTSSASPLWLMQDVDVETLMQEIRQLDPQDQADIAAAFQEDVQSSARVQLSASPGGLIGKEQLVGSPAQSLSPDRSQSHAAASASSSSEKVPHHAFLLALQEPAC